MASDRLEDLADTAHLRGDLRSRSVRAFGYGFASGGGDFVIRIISTAILARLISPEDFGLFMIVIAITAIADQFRDLGLSTATIQREQITHHEVTNLFWINVVAGSVLAVAVSLAAPLVAQYFRDDRLTLITIALASNFVLGGFVVQHEALMSRQMRHGTKALVRLGASAVSTVLAVAMASLKYGYWALVWREVGRSALIVIGIAYVCRWWPGLPSRATDVRSMVWFGKDLTFAYMLNVISAGLDRFLLGRFFGPESVALYRQPYQLVLTPMSQLMSPLYQVALPGMSMLQNDAERFRRYYLRLVTAVAMLSMPVYVFLAVYANELTSLILGPQWQGAALFFLIFALGGILRPVSSVAGWVLVSRGRSRPVFWTSLINAVVVIAFMVFGLRWGAVGVAIGEVASVIVMIGPWAYVSFRGSPVSMGMYCGATVRPLASSALMAAALVSLKQFQPIESPAVATVVGAGIGGLVLALAWWTMPGGRNEVMRLIHDVMASVRVRATAAATS